MIQLGAKGCRVRCIIGCDPEERVNLRDLFFDVEYQIDAPIQDDITATIDYVNVVQEISFLLEVRQYHLLEYAAVDILENLFSSINKLTEVTLVLHKPSPFPAVLETYVKIQRARK